MKSVALLIAFMLMVQTMALGQSVNPNDTLKIGQGSSSADKGIILDTGDGVNNKKIVIEKASKLLKFDGNSIQIGDGAGTDKEIKINGAGKTLKYDHSDSEFQVDDDLAIDAGQKLKTNSIDAKSGTETAVEQTLRAKTNLKIGTGSHELRVSGGNLEFSNDGALYKKIGSGSGSGAGGSGGINILANADFEDGISTGWTNSGGAFTSQNYVNPTENNLKFARFVASGAGQFVETALTVVPSFLGNGCQAQFEKYATATDGAWKIVVLDASSNVLATQNISQSGGASTFIASPLLSFSCPAAGQTFKLRMESLAAATIDLDYGYGGGNKNVVDIAQARLAGESFFGPASGCVWTRSSTTLGPFSSFLEANAACPGPTIIYSSMGQWQTTDSDLPRQIINNLPAGVYKAKFLANSSLSATAFSGFSINDGATTCSPVYGSGITSTQTVGGVYVECVFTYNSSGNRVFELYGASTSGTLNIDLGRAVLGIGVKFILEYYPNDSQTAVTSEQSSWFIDANIGGANPSLGVANVASYTGIENATLDMVLRSGSAPAQIGCSTTVSPSGLTCSSGSESVSVAWTPPHTGWFDVCFTFGHAMEITSGSIAAAFQIVETPTNAQTITSEGGQRSYSSFNVAGTSGIPHDKLCGTFYASSISQKMHRLMFEQSVSGAISQSLVVGDRDASTGQRDINVQVRPSTMNIARPVLTGDQVTTPALVRPITFSGKMTSGGTISRNKGGILATGSCTGGAYTVPFSRTLASAPNCVVGFSSVNNFRFAPTSVVETATGLSFLSARDGATYICGEDVTIICHGEL